MVAPGDVPGEFAEQVPGVGADGGGVDRGERLGDEVVDTVLDAAQRLGGDEEFLELLDLDLVEVGAADPCELASPVGVGAIGGECDEQRRLAFAEVVAHGLAGEFGVAEDAEDVVAQLERGAERESDRAQRIAEVVETAIAVLCEC